VREVKMASFTTRVELHDAKWSDYTALHEEMEKRGFSRTITSSDGKIYELPPAEYNYVGAVTRDSVHEKAKSAARAVKASFSVLVTEATGRTWSGMKVA
jgi:hypothetical protein